MTTTRLKLAPDWNVKGEITFPEWLDKIRRDFSHTLLSNSNLLELELENLQLDFIVHIMNEITTQNNKLTKLILTNVSFTAVLIVLEKLSIKTENTLQEIILQNINLSLRELQFIDDFSQKLTHKIQVTFVSPKFFDGKQQSSLFASYQSMQSVGPSVIAQPDKTQTVTASI